MTFSKGLDLCTPRMRVKMQKKMLGGKKKKIRIREKMLTQHSGGLWTIMQAGCPSHRGMSSRDQLNHLLTIGADGPTRDRMAACPGVRRATLDHVPWPSPRAPGQSLPLPGIPPAGAPRAAARLGCGPSLPHETG